MRLTKQGTGAGSGAVLRRKPLWSAVAAACLVTAMPPSLVAQEEEPEIGLEEVLVTAQRREQNQQDVPIALNAFSAEFLTQRATNDLGEIDIYTPGLSVNDSSTTQPRFSIRGVTANDFGIGTESATAVYVDGVYASRSGAALVFFSDIDRVEILKGPQGTLFGRNTAAGAISIATRQPDTEAFTFDTTLRLGNFDSRRVEATVNAPLADSFAVRVNALYNERDGFLTDSVNGDDLERDDSRSYRVAARWEPNDRTDLTVAFEHDRTREDGPAAVGVGPFSLSRDGFGRFANDVVVSRETRDLDGLSLRINHDLGWAELSSISGWKEFDTSNREDEDGTNLVERYFDTENIESNEHFYQELRLSGSNEQLSWTAGVSYYDEEADQTSATEATVASINSTLANTPFGPVFQPFLDAGLPLGGLPWRESMMNSGSYESIAAFADVSWAVSDVVNLTVGGRFTEDDKRFTWFNGSRTVPGLDQFNVPAPLVNPALPPDLLLNLDRDVFAFDVVFDFGVIEGQQIARDESWSDFSPRVVVDYKPQENILWYFSLAEGYKAGGFNALAPNSVFDPEDVLNIEGGVKSDWYDGRLRFNGSVYRYEYDDQQQISLETDVNQTIPQYQTVTGDSTGVGADLELQWLATSNLRLGLLAGLIDAEWDRRTERGVDVSGQPTGEPDTRVVLLADYNKTLPNNRGSIAVRFDHSYTSEQRINDAGRLRDAQLSQVEPTTGLPLVDPAIIASSRDDRSISNVRVSWISPTEKYRVSAWAKNLFDEERIRGIGEITALTLGTPFVRLEDPRFYGLEFSFSM